MRKLVKQIEMFTVYRLVKITSLSAILGQKSAGAMKHCKISNSKHQISGFRVSGVREEKQKH
jgi:hypothetical protein